MLLKANDLILFQGDSITDAARPRGNDSQLGIGYAAKVAAMLDSAYPEKRFRFLNRGIGGDRVRDLRARWREEAIDLKPDWVSLLVGINDTWRRFDNNDPTSIEEFEHDYRYLLETLNDETNARLILMEPFVLPTPEDRLAWREDLDPKIQAVRKLAREFGALYVPLDGAFAAAAMKREPSFWAHDGVHPSQAGHMLIAREWLRTVGASA